MMIVAALIATQSVQSQPLPQVARVTAPQAELELSPQVKLRRDARALVAHARAFSRGYTPGPGQPTRTELDAAIQQMKAGLDSNSEMGEMESLRLQMTMDRMSKLMSTLSNILKKAGDTDQSIIQNIK